jgi:hypothetical protein
MSRRALRSLLTLVVLCTGALPLSAGQNAALERGAAITDPLALRELDHGRFGIERMLLPERSANVPLGNAVLFSLSSMQPVRAALEAEFERYVARHQEKRPNESIGVGEGFSFQLFDRALIYSPDTRFVLAGIVNRMDRAYVSEAGCGEIRLIYRLTRLNAPPAGGSAVSPRLPMTLNLVLRARRDGAIDRAGRPATCAGIARRWLATSELALTGAPLAERLLGADGPLDLIDHQNIARIETNIQIAFAPKSAVRDFRTDYLLKVFDYDAQTRRFDEAPLENQIDRDRILADDNLRREFRSWLLAPDHVREFDRGTILIPDKFLARAALAPTPAGLDPSELQPEFGLTQGEGTDKNRGDPVFTEHDVVAALKQAAARGVSLENIRSVAGFQRRLNDITCAGCHQTRGIGGFHFPGVDWMTEKPSNATIVPASPHFFGDQVRRRDILLAFRDGRRPDFSRGFSSRPQLRGSTELAGTEYQDGWGAHCYSRRAGSGDGDRSFLSWSCAKGLTCEASGPSRMGMCFVKGP